LRASINYILCPKTKIGEFFAGFCFEVNVLKLNCNGFNFLVCFWRDFGVGIDCRQFFKLRDFSVFDKHLLVKKYVFVKIYELWRI